MACSDSSGFCMTPSGNSLDISLSAKTKHAKDAGRAHGDSPRPTEDAGMRRFAASQRMYRLKKTNIHMTSTKCQ